jgi:hypothetical protein
MTTDPIVREVREIRHEIERECQQDPEKYFQRLKASQEKLAGRLVCRQPKPLVTVEQRKCLGVGPQ